MTWPQQAPTKWTTFGCRRVAVKRISARKALTLASVTSSIVFTATGCPRQVPLKTSPNEPAPTRFTCDRGKGLSYNVGYLSR